MKQCPICQTTNDAQALFCAECGHRFQAQAQAQMPQTQPQLEQAPPPQTRPTMLENKAPQPVHQETAQPQPKPKKIKLHSPILGGDEDFEDEEPYPQSSSRPGSKAKKGLRSPLLGSEEDDSVSGSEFPRRSQGQSKHTSQSSTSKKAKPKLRSPLLGDEDDDDDDIDMEPNPRRNKSSRGPSSGHSSLRSPLLGGDDLDFGEPAPRPGKSGSKSRLRSPVLGGAEDYLDPYEDIDEEDEEDPNALRSPLLRARTHKHDQKKEENVEAHSNLTAQPPQPPLQQPLQQAIAPPYQAPIMPTPGQMPNVPSPLQSAPLPRPSANPPPNAMPTTNMPPLPMPAAAPEAVPAAIERPVTAEKPIESRVKQMEQVGPSDRRSDDRRAPRERRSFASLRDDENQGSNYDSANQAQSAPLSASACMAVIITAGLGAMYKLYYLFTILSKFGMGGNELLVLDQLTTLIVFVGLIIFAIGAKKS